MCTSLRNQKFEFRFFNFASGCLLVARMQDWAHRIFCEGPICSVLLSFLTPLEWVCLSKAVPCVRTKFATFQSQLMVSRIRKGLTTFFGNANCTDVVMSRLLTCDYTLVGSFLLAVITGDNFEPNDIDIVCPNDDEQLFRDLQRLGAEEVERPDTENNYAHNLLKHVITLRICEKIVQFLVVTRVHAYVSDFDLDICKNYFNAATGLYIGSIDSLIHRRCTLNMERICLFRRQVKCFEDSVCRVELNRAKKYRQRGFTIRFDPIMKEEDLAFILFNLYDTSSMMLSCDKFTFCRGIALEWSRFWAANNGELLDWTVLNSVNCAIVQYSSGRL
jgi:hypothetical protein